MLKRIASLLMIISFIFALFSCAQREEEEFDIDIMMTGTDISLDGFEYRIRFYDHYVPEDGALFGYRPSSAYNDAVMSRIRDIESRYNCTIETSNATGADLDSNIIPILISGQRFYDTVLSSSWNLRPIIESGIFEPLSQVSNIIDYTDSGKWGNWRILEQSVWDGNLYGLVPVKWPGVAVTSGWMFIFNEKMAGLMGQPDPREYLENRTWSRDKLGEMMLTYTTEDLGHPLKALLVYEGHFYDTALRANNAQTYKLVNGEYVSGYHTPEGLDALDWADRFLHVDYADCTYQPVPGDSERNAIFINEDVAMFLSHVTNIYGANSEIPFNVENYCVLPMPNGPEREKQNAPYTTAFERVHANIFFPINGNIDCSAFIANELFEALDGFSAEELKDYNLRNYFHDERDYDLVREVFDNSRYTFYSDGFRGLVVEPLYGNHSKTVTEVLDSSEEAFNERVTKYIVPTVTTLIELFGEEVLENN